MAVPSSRDRVRQISSYNEEIRVSLQERPPIQNYSRLCQLYNETRSETKKNLYQALMDILASLLIPVDFKERVVHPKEMQLILSGEQQCEAVGWVNFHDAFESFVAMCGT